MDDPPMTNGLYFISIIASAFEQADPRKALQAAFAEISRVGANPAYRAGHNQFLEFMNCVERAAAHDHSFGADDNTEAILTALREPFTEGGPSAPEGDDGNALTAERWKEWCEAVHEAFDEEHDLSVSEANLVIQRNGRPIHTVNLALPVGNGSIRGIEPGRYRICTASDRLLWEGALTEEHLVWSAAYPGEPLDLAADNESSYRREPTLERSLWNGELTLRVFPGPESGTLKIFATRGNRP